MNAQHPGRAGWPVVAVANEVAALVAVGDLEFASMAALLHMTPGQECAVTLPDGTAATFKRFEWGLAVEAQEQK